MGSLSKVGSKFHISVKVLNLDLSVEKVVEDKCDTEDELGETLDLLSMDLLFEAIQEPDGGVYVGETVGGKYEGFGKHAFKNGRYVGQFKDGKYHGKGTLQWADGAGYVGDFENGFRSGRGVYRWANGATRYEGEWRNNRMHGQGAGVLPDGQTYVGQYENDKENGRGTTSWPNGDKYEGEYKDGWRHGQGTYYYYNGNRYVGQWNEGKPHGQGTYFWPSGAKWEGPFVDGEMHGTGTYTDAGGEPQLQLRNHGEIVDSYQPSAPTYSSNPLDDLADCFIATAAYGSPWEKHVVTLRSFRDERLMAIGPGRWFVGAYYRWSPPLAAAIAKRPWARAMARAALTPLVIVAGATLGRPADLAILVFTAASAVWLIRLYLRRRRKNTLSNAATT